MVKKHCLHQESTPNGINPHRMWYCEINDIQIYSNDDILGDDKFYITDGEQADTIWYPSPTAAAIAYFERGILAVNKTARRYGY